MKKNDGFYYAVDYVCDVSTGAKSSKYFETRGDAVAWAVRHGINRLEIKRTDRRQRMKRVF